MPNNQRPAPASHPYVETLYLDPADFHAFEKWADCAPEYRVLDCDQTHPDLWPVRVASASKKAASRLHDLW